VIFDRPGKELGIGVSSGKGIPRSVEEIVSSKNMEPRLPKAFAESSSATEQVNNRSA
jgi:hypothetical protein